MSDRGAENDVPAPALARRPMVSRSVPTAAARSATIAAARPISRALALQGVSRRFLGNLGHPVRLVQVAAQELPDGYRGVFATR